MIIQGNCLDVMKTKPSNSVDSIVTDPPYGLSFMGKKWDYDVPSVEIWKECLRVLKPGGYLLSFAGTRTQHRICVNIEDAGFEIRDMIAWVYGSGFPKSHNIGKAVDKLQGNVREFVSEYKYPDGSVRIDYGKTKGTSFDCGKSGADITKGNSPYEGWGTALKPALEPITVARKPFKGTVANNVLKYGTGGINIDGCRVGDEKLGGGTMPDLRDVGAMSKESIGIDKLSCGQNPRPAKRKEQPTYQGRFPANLIHDGSQMVLDLFPDTVPTSYATDKTKKGGMFGMPGHGTEKIKDTTRSASRFFKEIKLENECSLCYNTLHKLSNNELCKNTNVSNVKKSLKTTQATKEFTAQKSATGNLNDKSVQLVKYVANLCDSCGTDIVQGLVAISESQKDVQSQEVLQVIQDFIGNYRKCILIQNLANYVEQMDSIDTTQTTQNLLKLFGYVLPAIKNYIRKTEKSEPKRFLYQAKASKSERNEGCEGLEKKATASSEFRPNHTEKAKKGEDGNPYGRWTPTKNNHPTVKPTKLMQYLVRLVTPKGGRCLDPFMGSGSTGKACKLEGFRFIGIELDEKYFEIAQNRINMA